MTSAITPPLAHAHPPKTDAQLRQAAEDFTAVALNQMLAPIFATTEDPGPFGGGAGERTFRPMMIAEIARHIAQAGGLGLTDTVYRQMLRLQEQT